MCAPGITYTYKKSNTAPGTRYTRRAFKPLFLIGSIHIEGTPRFGRKAGAASRDTPTLNIATALCYYVLSIYFGRESSIWCGGDPFHLDRHHKDMPGTTHHTYHTRYDRGEPAASSSSTSSNSHTNCSTREYYTLYSKQLALLRRF